MIARIQPPRTTSLPTALHKHLRGFVPYHVHGHRQSRIEAEGSVADLAVRIRILSGEREEGVGDLGGEHLLVFLVTPGRQLIQHFQLTQLHL